MEQKKIVIVDIDGTISKVGDRIKYLEAVKDLYNRAKLKAMKKKRLLDTDIVNWWLEKYHNTNTDEVLKLHPEWDDGDHSREFYEAYQVTQEQLDEWYDWMISALMKEFGCGKEYTKRSSWAIYLNSAPMVSTSPKEDTQSQGHQPHL